MNKFIVCLLALVAVSAESNACRLTAGSALRAAPATSEAATLDYSIDYTGTFRGRVVLPGYVNSAQCRVTLQGRLKNNAQLGRIEKIMRKQAEGQTTYFFARALPAVMNISKRRASILYLRAIVNCGGGTVLTTNSVGRYLDCGRGPVVTATKFIESLKRKVS